ncbi:MAG: XRE family transcriptional regulator [Deltaproteobacteria bacterium]|nr:MAG: XRE family transcriptional regulator [Deltaproteobacteria bacterium]
MNNNIKNEYRPDAVTPPGETLQEILVTMGMTKAELADRIGRTPKHIGEIIKHGSPITPTTAMELEKVLGTPASFWNSRERRYREILARQQEEKRLQNEVRWLKTFPVTALIKAKWIQKAVDKSAQASELLRFFGVASSKQWEKIWLAPSTAYRKSKSFKTKPEACSAWLRKGELQAMAIDCAPFDRNKFTDSLVKIRNLTRKAPEQFGPASVELCAASGVALVFTPSIKGVPVYGATCWLTPGKAMIQLSLRGKYEDMLWFTFFHEAGHILLHGKKEIFIESEDRQDEKEQAADRFAANFLIPQPAWKKFVKSEKFKNQAAVELFAKELNIAPAVVVGRLQHEGLIPFSHLNGLRRRFEIKTK